MGCIFHVLPAFIMNSKVQLRVYAKMVFECNSMCFKHTDITLLRDTVHKASTKNLVGGQNTSFSCLSPHFYQRDSQLCCGYGFTHSTDFKGQNYRGGADKEIPGLRSGPAAPHPIKEATLG